MSSVEKERGAVREMEPNGVSGSKKVDEPRQEKKRRLVLSDSEAESDHPVVSSRKRNCRTGVDIDSSIDGEVNGMERVKEEEQIEVENKKNNKDLHTDVVKHSKEVVVDKKAIVQLELGRKRSRDSFDAQKRGKKNSLGGGSKSKTVSSHGVDEKNATNADKVGNTKPIVSANEVNRESHTESSSYKTSEIEDDLMKSSCNLKLRVKDSSNSVVVDRRTDLNPSRCKDGVQRVQGKSGVLRVLPHKKLDGLVKNKWRRKDEENPDDSSSCRVTRGRLKQPSLSPDFIDHDKSSQGAKLSKIKFRKSKYDIADKSRFNESKEEQEIVSPKREKKRADISKNNSGLESCSNSKTALIEKEKANNASESRRTEKQKLRDQIKEILLNSGWTIDLRPRKGRNYEDSVYVPPGGGGGYWSITKAYKAYEEQQNKTGSARAKISSGRSSRTSAIDSIIPMEALDILKRVSVNKRRSKKELAEVKRDKRRKLKRTSDYRHPRGQNYKLDESRGKKGSNSNSVVSSARKPLKKGRNKQRGCALLVRGSNLEAEVEDDDYVPYVWKRTVLSWMIDMGVLPINGKVKYMNQRKTNTKLEGWITRDGINCSCCNKILTLSKFELHAGSKLLQPSQNIFLEDGQVSLLQCQLDAWKKQDESERQGFYRIDVSGDDPNDDTCGICGDGGSLICCDGCPSTFHLGCLDIEKLPPGDWHCTNCCCRYCGDISTDVIRESGTVSSLFSCQQCEAKFHPDCIPDGESVSVTSSTNTSYCSESCRKVLKQLQKILGKKNDLEGGFSWSVIRRLDEDASKSQLNFLVAECNPKIAVALAVMDECFLPIVDQRSGINLIHNVVYNCGSNFSRLNYKGFYSFILEKGDEIICVASIRIHGTRMAEMPFIGTRNMYRRQGMCRRFLKGIESALCSLNVQMLIIPAISELKNTWIDVFGFEPLEVTQELDVRSTNILVFPGTGLLQKPLLKMHSSDPCTSDGVEMVENDIKDQHDRHSAKDHYVNSAEDEHCISSVKNSVDSTDPARLKCSYAGLKSSEKSGIVCMHTSEGGFNDSLDEDKSEVDRPTDRNTEFTTEVISFNNVVRKNVESHTSADIQEGNDISKQMPPKAEVSYFQNPGPSSPSIFSCNSVSVSLQHKSEERCSSPDFVTCILKQNVRNDEERAVCSLESTTPVCNYEPHGIIIGHPPNSVINDYQSLESTHAIDDDEKSHMNHLEATIHVSSEESIQSSQKVKDGDAAPNSVSAKDEFLESLAFEVASRSKTC